MNVEKWKEATRQILVAMDVRSEYTAMGLRVSSSKPRTTGWLPCHAIDREDRTPSAEINVGDGPARGRYRDFGGDGTSYSFFDFAVAHGPFVDWKQSRNHFAKQTGVKLPRGDEDARAVDKLELYDLTPVGKMMWCRRKQGVSPRAISQVGGRGARWPRGLAPQIQQFLLTIPMFGSALLETDPVAYHSAPLYGRQIRKWRGKDNEPDLIRTMTLGSPGLMNVWALRHLGEAEVVWLVEGLSDMLALQTALEERTDHVVVSCGGASYSLAEELCPHFQGKDIRICYDNDEAGRNGAKVQVGRLVDVAGEIRNISLPKGVKDLRDHLNSGKDYADLWQYSQTFDLIQPADKSEQLEPHQALLTRLGIVVCGQLDGTESIEIYSRDLHKTTLVRDINRFTLESAILAVGKGVEDHVTDEKDGGPTKRSIKDLRKAIVKEGSTRLLSSRPAIGCGIWPAGESIVLVGPRHADVYTPSGDLESLDTPALGEQRLKFNGESWYDRGELQRNLNLAGDINWVQETFSEAVSLFEKWDNWTQETTPQLVAALVCATWIQTLWAFRPLVGILGPTNCGKSLLLEETLPFMFGGLKLFCTKPTEPGLRQAIGDMSMAVVIDEFEKCDHRAKVLEYLRTSSRGGHTLRGTTGSKGAVAYGLKHIVWVGAIEINLPTAADANRFLIFHLGSVNLGPAKLQPLEPVVLRDLGQRLLAIVVRRHREILKRASDIKQIPIAVDNRVLELYSVPAAVIAEVGQFDRGATVGFLKAVLAEQIVEEHQSDEASLVAEILESHVQLPRGRKETISAVLRGDGGPYEDNSGQAMSRDDVLGSVGIRVVNDDSGLPVEVFFAKNLISKHLLSRTTHRDQDIAMILCRINGAERNQQRIGGHSPRGVLVPITELQKLVGLDIPWGPERQNF